MHSKEQLEESLSVYKVGIRFEPLGQELVGPTTEDDIEVKHWNLIFQPISDPDTTYQLDILTGDETFYTRLQPVKSLTSHPVALYTGHINDVTEVLTVHPMRKTKYDECFNNCQHWVAILLRFLAVVPTILPNRDFRVCNEKRWDAIQDVLSSNGPETLYNRPNARLQAVYIKTTIGAAITYGASAILAESVVATVVPASGVLGWLGVTSAAVAPAAYAGIAAFTAPLAATVATSTITTYGFKYYSWRKASTFLDPIKMGFPIGKEPLSEDELTIPEQLVKASSCGNTFLISLIRDLNLTGKRQQRLPPEVKDDEKKHIN